MATVNLTLPHHSYRILIEDGALQDLGEWVVQAAPHERCGLFCDRNVQGELGGLAARSLEAAGYSVCQASLSANEHEKNLDAVRKLYDAMLGAKLERRSPVIALGGGVVGDTVGFAAATYLRGLPFVQCPTTLLAMVDASVGGKTGVNLPQGKNLIGAFHQPSLVVIDPRALRTLPKRELRGGLAECIKHGMIRDPDLFDWIDANADAILALDTDALLELLERNVQIKANVVMEDEKESGVRAHLNFGHTFGHAIEATQGIADGSDHDADESSYHHGEAVALGMVAATRLAVAQDKCERETLDRLVAVLQRFDLPTESAALPSSEELIAAMRLDKKVQGSRIRLVLPIRIGEVTVDDRHADAAIATAWDAIRSR